MPSAVSEASAGSPRSQGRKIRPKPDRLPSHHEGNKRGRRRSKPEGLRMSHHRGHCRLPRTLENCLSSTSSSSSLILLILLVILSSRTDALGRSGNKNSGTVGVGGGETQSVFVELPSAAKTSEFFHGQTAYSASAAAIGPPHSEVAEAELGEDRFLQGEGRARHDAGLENADVEGNGDSSKAKRDEVVTPRPIIGILSQEISANSWLAAQFDDTTAENASYIAASYVKFVESAGARVAPIMIDREPEYYRKMFESTNGLLIPGGAVSLFDSGFASAGKSIWHMALESGDYPIWGTCLGFELIATLSHNQSGPVLRSCSSHDRALALNLSQEEWEGSRLGRATPEYIKDILAEQRSTVNFHTMCLTPQNVTKFGLNSFWHTLATNVDDDGVEFVSLIEAKGGVPIWGSQFHPEKNAFEWTTIYKNIPHSLDAIRAAAHFADFFVERARRLNRHRFSGGREEEEKYLIYNWAPRYTGKEGATMEQIYLFY